MPSLESPQSAMKERPSPLPCSSSTRLTSAKSELPLQFLFVNQLEEKKANSSYGFAARSHIRKRAISERRRQNAATKLCPQQPLPRLSSRSPLDVDTLRCDLKSAPTQLIPYGSKIFTCCSPTRSHLKPIVDQSRNSSDEEELRYGLLSNRPHIVETKKPRHKLPDRRCMNLGEIRASPQAPFRRHESQKAEVNLHAHRVHLAVESPASILGAAKIDPFRSYPADADRHEHWLIDYYTAVMAQPFPKDKRNGYTLLLTKFVPYCLMHKMAFKSILLAAETHSRGMAGLATMSPRAMKLSLETYTLLNEEIGKPNLVVTDAMIATVINLAGVELQYGGQRSIFKSHLRGLNQLVKLRGGLNNLTRDGFLKDIVIWCHQMGGEFLVAGPHGADTPVAVQEEDSRKPRTRSARGSPLISNDMIQILRSIHHLTRSQTSSTNTSPVSSLGNNLSAAFFSIKQQLNALKSSTTTASLEEACILSAELYIDKILLNVPFKELFKSAANEQLQDAIMKPRKNAQEVEDNKEILEWIVSVQGMNVFMNGSEVVEKFNNMVRRLEGLCEDS